MKSDRLIKKSALMVRKLLTEIATDLSFALDNFASQAESLSVKLTELLAAQGQPPRYAKAMTGGRET